jgi:hypothetical protein
MQMLAGLVDVPNHVITPIGRETFVAENSVVKKAPTLPNCRSEYDQ